MYDDHTLQMMPKPKLKNEKSLLPVGALNREDLLKERLVLVGVASKRGLWQAQKVGKKVMYSIHQFGKGLEGINEKKQKGENKGENPKSAGASFSLLEMDQERKERLSDHKYQVGVGPQLLDFDRVKTWDLGL